jgi:iron complex outermembrane recepter protein
MRQALSRCQKTVASLYVMRDKQMGEVIMKLNKIALLVTTAGLAMPAFAQDAPRDPSQDKPEAAESIIVTGSRIKRAPEDSALPLQIISTEELKREGIASPEQLVAYLSTNGSGADNLASNADVVTGQQRGNNGSSSANLRGQGSGATLVLLNGRRVAAHGLNGGSVDVNQIPFAAIERVEILKDGASAIYGTDAIGGVINFILKKDFTGVQVSGFADLTEQGGGNIYRTSGIVGYGDLNENGFNIMAAASYSWNRQLRGDQRDFVNTFQPERGLSVDTRGTPFATILPLAGTAITTATAPFVPGSTTIRASGGINVLDLPGGPGCGVIDGQAPYDAVLWEFPQAQFACAWDTGRAAVLQQPLKTLTYLTRGVARLGDHEFSAEFTGSDADSSKRFSNLQLTPNTSTQNYAYRRNAGNAAIFDDIATRLVGAFPTLGTQIAANPALSYRWRCIECGRREINTNTKTSRLAFGVEGPIGAGFDYRAGYSLASSKSQSVLGTGYYYRGTLATGANDPTAPIAPGLTQPGIIGVLNSGQLNPFLLPGQTQSQAALDLLKAVSAEGVTLFGGKYTVQQVDGSVSGRLFDLPGGAVQIAVGADFRTEKYKFNGDARAAAARPTILAAPFDDGNQLAGVTRKIKAAYAEMLIPVHDTLEYTLAVRVDDYTGFGRTVNPKASFKWQPVRPVTFRGSYNTGFRVPSFNLIFNGTSTALYTGRDIADPGTCPGGRANAAITGCGVIQPDIVQGGKLDLGPEKSKQASLGIVFQPTDRFSASFDWWQIRRTDTIQFLTLNQLADNFSIFQDRYIRNDAGVLVAIDQRPINAGESVTRGLEVALRGGGELGAGKWSVGLDGSYLLTKKERVVPSAPFGASQLGVFTFSGDLGLKWKHSAFVSYNTDKWGVAFSQLFRNGYTNQELPGVTSGAVTPPGLEKRVNNYITYNLSANYELFKGLRLTAGVKNIFNTDPPFAVTYDSNTGSGSSWEPRVADPRGRAFTLLVNYEF